MISIDKVVKFNAQTAGREKLIRLCQFTTKLVSTLLRAYYAQYAKGGRHLLEYIYKLRELEQYFASCRRIMSFGCCADQVYSALRTLQLYDPVLRTCLSTSKLSLSVQMFADHIIWLNQIGLMHIDKSSWAERANRFWLYSVTVNLLRDFYELICIVHETQARDKHNLDSGLKDLSLSSPIRWARRYPKLSCDLIKNLCDFWIPYSAVNKLELHSIVIATLGIVSSTMGIMQVYDNEYKLSPS